MHRMREEGLAIKSSAMGVRQNAPAENQELLEDDSDDEQHQPGPSRSNMLELSEMNPEEEFLANLSTKQKKKLFKKLKKIHKFSGEMRCPPNQATGFTPPLGLYFLTSINSRSTHQRAP